LQDLDSWKKLHNAHCEKRKAIIIDVVDNENIKPKNATDNEDLEWDDEFEAIRPIHRSAFENAEELEQITQKVKESLAFVTLETDKDAETFARNERGSVFESDFELRSMEDLTTQQKQVLVNANIKIMAELEDELHQMELNGIASTLNQNIQNYELERLYTRIDNSNR